VHDTKLLLSGTWQLNSNDRKGLYCYFSHGSYNWMGNSLIEFMVALNFGIDTFQAIGQFKLYDTENNVVTKSKLQEVGR
jgi:hypothetical protein